MLQHTHWFYLVNRGKESKLLERVQHRYTRMVPKLKKLSYEQRLEYLGLCTLEKRRNRADLLEVLKMYKGSSATPFNDFFVLQTATHISGPTAKLVKNRCRLDLRQHFFSERVIDSWNSLEQCVIDSATVSAFKNGLRRTWNNKMGFFVDSFAGPYRPHWILEILFRNRCGLTW